MVDEGFDLGSAGDDSKAKTKTHTDLRRMKAGGLDAEFFAVYVGREFVVKKPAEEAGPLAARWTSSILSMGRCSAIRKRSRWPTRRVTFGASPEAERLRR